MQNKISKSSRTCWIKWKVFFSELIIFFYLNQKKKSDSETPTRNNLATINNEAKGRRMGFRNARSIHENHQILREQSKTAGVSGRNPHVRDEGCQAPRNIFCIKNFFRWSWRIMIFVHISIFSWCQDFSVHFINF